MAMTAPIVLKISGHELDDAAYLREFASILAQQNQPVIIVHGGGKEISALQTRLGIEPRYIDGVRITDPDSLSLVEMVMCGTINKRLVRTLLAAGVQAIGLSGVDGGIVQAVKMQHPTVDMGFTGQITRVNANPLQTLLDQGYTPVLAPVSLGEDTSYNVNADSVAGAVAAAVGASRVIFISNVPGVMQNGEVLPTLTSAQVEALIADGTIFGGMIPKVKTALEALTSGIRQSVITNLAGLQNAGGTVFTAE
jgi:acetylglutamate kinase